MHVHVVRTPALGDSSYLLTHGGAGVVVDPQRDIGRVLELVEDTGVTVTHVLETHVHNDYLSGAPALAHRLDADLVLPAGAGVGFAFVPAFHTEELAGEGGLSIRPLHTPGHTPEHTSYVVVLEGAEQAVFTGGSLLVGAAGRTDLLGSELAASLARLQHGSLQRLARLPGEVGVYPTHGAGSFCTASGAGEDTSTIAAERASNPVLAYPDADAFVEGQLAGLLPYPDYYAHMAPLNRRGPDPVDDLAPPQLSADDLERLLQAGATVIDPRPRNAYADGHLPGSLNVEAGDSFAPWVGWLAPFGSPIVLVDGDGVDPAGLATELARIGYEVAGAIPAAELPATAEAEVASTDQLEERLGEVAVLDVRDPSEWASGHLRHSVHRYVPDLRGGLPEGVDGEVWVVCASGYRSAVAAGLVERHGARPVVVAPGGVGDVLARRPDLAAPVS